MSSRRSEGKNSFSAAAAGVSSSSKGKNVEGSGSFNDSPNLEQLNREMADINLDTAEGGEWEVIGKKSKSRVAATAGKTRGSSTPSKDFGQSEGLPRQGPGINGRAGRGTGSSWSQAAINGRTARGNPKPQGASRQPSYRAPAPAAEHPPLQHGMDWRARFNSSSSQQKVEDKAIPQDGCVDGHYSDSDIVHNQPEDDSDDDELLEDSDELSDDYDSDASQRSHETRKKSKWFKGFFDALDRLTVEEASDVTRQWHCPACHNGPGAIDWYKGLQPLVAHAKTKGAKRAKLHRELSKLLDEDLRRKGSSAVPAGEAFGKWRGLRETTTDHEIVWPPMVIVMNTLLEQDDNEKWIGMGNQELLEYFSTYAAAKARHSYGPHGHRGMSVLIFEATAMGYLEAERLHKHFSEQHTDRDAWERRRQLFYPGGERQLYGYLASREDVNSFNQHCHGKSKLKFEMKSYQEMVVVPMKQMSEDNQQLLWLKNTVVKQERHKKALEQTVGVVSQKLREYMEENKMVRHRTKMQHEENKQEMDYQEQFFKEQMNKVQKDIEEKEQKYKMLLREERAKAKQFDLHSGNKDSRLRKEVIDKFIDSQEKGAEEFLSEREMLISSHEKKRDDLRRRYLEEEVEMEKAFEAALTALMEKYDPGTFQASSSSSA
ncbi:protein SUPPRESSOR OF GENE SILENCING 3-like protein [Iris pallida]|uniref:Protein SUPPRESSOR OF GENE SILENCING 3-like protein n=1 Tax=Iris pallida TaxID=29817 RepID=A0AAX6E4G8_IRIPA|nr:protein SUPPRESSOR OF GENE SILENCING 3-like protein [Iris pallida]